MTAPLRDPLADIERVILALNDWVHQYAPDHCRADTVEATERRIRFAGGTLAYIADALEAARAVKAWKDQRASAAESSLKSGVRQNAPEIDSGKTNSADGNAAIAPSVETQGQRMTEAHQLTLNDLPVCPNCKYTALDAWEIDFGPGLDGDTTVSCGSCGEDYFCSRQVSTYYTTRKLTP